MEQKRTVGQATASMVLGILSLIVLGIIAAIPAVICGHIAKSKIRKDPDNLGGEGQALAGLITGYLAIGLSILIIPAILAAMAIPLMSGNMERAIETEGQAGCSTVSTLLRMHGVEQGGFSGVDSVDDLASYQPGDLDGYYFKESGYQILSIQDSDNYVISATGEGRDGTVVVVMKVVNGEVSWTFSKD